MAIRHKRKNSTGYAWQSSDLVEGQIGLNIADGTAHIKKANGTVVAIGGNGGSEPAEIILGASQLTLPNTANTVTSEVWQILAGSSVSGVSVSGTNGTITVPAGTYYFEMYELWGNNVVNNLKLRNFSTSSDIFEIEPVPLIVSGTTYRSVGNIQCRFTLASSANIGFVGTSTNELTLNGLLPGQSLSFGAGATNSIRRNALVRLYKIS